MKNCWRLVLILLVCWTTTSWAETRYISDQLIVSLREQPQNSAQSITYLKTDTPVEVLGEQGEFIKVKTPAGETGYIKQNYLTAAIPKSITIDKLQRELDRIAAKAAETRQRISEVTSKGDKSLQELAAQLTEARDKASALQDELAKSQAELKQTGQDYRALQKDAGNVIAIIKERDQLLQTNQELTASLGSLEAEVTQLTKTGVIKWFLAGAGVLLVGWIIGKSGGRKRRSLL